MNKSSHVIQTLEEMHRYAEGFAENIKAKPFCVVTLEGDLAAGKTTFVQMVAKYLGITEHVQSPTYAVLRSYPITSPAQVFHHLDLYRVDDAELLAQYGIFELLHDKKGLFFIEWPEVAYGILQSLRVPIVSLKLTVHGDVREVVYSEKIF